VTEVECKVFYRGILLALRAYGETFHADARTHKAFGEMLRPHSDLMIKLGDMDPVFGTYHAAEEMILEGMCGFILCLEGPSLIKARFIITKEQAAKELAEITYADVYRDLARVFYEHAS
jgi:hypothetical protein